MTRLNAALALTLAATAIPASIAQPSEGSAEAKWRDQTGYEGAYVVIQEDDAPRPPFDFDADDNAFLDEVERATFNWIWNSPDVSPHGLIKDRSSGPLVSIAGVGYQLASIVIGVERGYVSRDEGAERAEQILQALTDNPKNRKAGLFYHFLDENTNGPRARGDGVSTIDSSILFAGILTASSYFGGDVAHLGDALFAAADWSFFVQPDSRPEQYRGMISLLWRPNDRANDPTGDGGLIDATWIDAMGEQRLVYFLANAAPAAEHRVDPELYYRMRRTPAQWRDVGPMIRLPGAGSTFLAFFDQLWIDDASIGAAQGPDRPDLRGFEHRTPTDWWENSRRHAKLHRGKAIHEAPEGFTTLGENAWGLSASDAPGGYRVPGLYGDPLPLKGARRDVDTPPDFRTDDWLDGTVAIYGAGSMIMFEPDLALAALRHYRSLENADGKPLLWDDQYGFEDAYNLHINKEPWVAHDRLSIDQGPLLVAIENARSGLIWNTFHAHPYIQSAMERLGLSRGED